MSIKQFIENFKKQISDSSTTKSIKMIINLYTGQGLSMLTHTHTNEMAFYTISIDKQK